MVFACHKTHMLHDKCFDEMKKFAKKKQSPLTCPICRKEIEEDKIVKKKLAEAEAKEETYDPFAI